MQLFANDEGFDALWYDKEEKEKWEIKRTQRFRIFAPFQIVAFTSMIDAVSLD